MRALVRLLPTFVASAALLAAGRAEGQSTGYEISYSGVPFTPITGGSTYNPTSYAFGYADWDEGAAAIPLAFPVSWYGRTYNTVYAYTNGFLSFEAPPPPGSAGILRPPAAVPDATNVPHAFIAPMWSDLTGVGSNMQITGQIRAEVSGTAPSRRFTVQMSGLHRAQNPSSNAAFQVIFDEAGGYAQIVYGPSNGITAATTAIENDTGLEGGNLLENPTGCPMCMPCPARTCGSINWPTGLTIYIAPPAAPELIGSIAGPRGAYPGTTFTATLAVANIGLGAAGAFDAEIRLSADTTIDATDQLLTTVSFAGLASGAGAQATRVLTMPSPIATARFYLGVIVDPAGAVIESVESNNTAYDPFGIVSGPDLRGTLTSPFTSGPGELLDVVLDLRSDGAPVLAPIPVQFFLSDNATLDMNDTDLGIVQLGLQDGFAEVHTVTLAIPAGIRPSPPSYRVFASIDPAGAVGETEENNNVALAPQALTLSAAELETNRVGASPFAFRGLPYPITSEIANNGGTDARRFTVCAVLSRNTLISVVSDPVIARTGTITLAAGGSTTVRLEPVIPTTTGTGAWYLAVVADCESGISETNEQNNVARTADPITVRDPAPDFVATQVATASIAAAGEALAISISVANYGTLPGSAHVRVLISPDADITAADTPIFETTMPIALDPAHEQTFAVWAPLPSSLPTGDYHVGAVVDPDELVEEVVESNNVALAGPVPVAGSDLAIVGPAPPIAVIGVDYVWRFTALGGTGDYTWSIDWATGRAPDGLSFDAATGELSSTPGEAAEGSHDLMVTVTTSAGSASRAFRLLVMPPALPLSIISGRLPPALDQESYSLSLVAIGGIPPYTWSLGQNAALPAGLNLDANGLLSGVPRGVNAYMFGVQVCDAAMTCAEETLALDVLDPSAGLTIVTADIPSGVVGMPYAAMFAVMGGRGPYQWRFESEPIPGLELGTGTSASITGTPTIAGSYPLIVEVRDAQGQIDRNAYVLEIFEVGDVVITTGQTPEDALPRGRVGEPYVLPEGVGPVQLRAARRSGMGNLGQLAWSVVLGDLPPGIALDNMTGVLAGSPIQAGVYAFTVMTRDKSGDSDRATLAIVVDAPPGTPGGGGGGGGDGGCNCSAGGATSSSSAPFALLGLGVGLLLVFRRRRGALAVVSIAAAASQLASPGDASAQSFPYHITMENVPFTALANPTQIVPSLGDGGTAQIPLPFEVQLYGAARNLLYVNANGFVSIAPTTAGHHFAPSSNPRTQTPNGFVAGMWADWCASYGPPCNTPAPLSRDVGVYYQIDSTPGRGKVTVEYRSLRHFGDTTAASAVTFQITLYEGVSGQIDLHYGPITAGLDGSGNPVDFRARIGIENINGTEGMWLGPCGVGTRACTGLDAQGLGDQRIRILVDSGPDVAVTGLSAPPLGYPGLPLSVSAVYGSRHRNALGPGEVSAVLVRETETSTEAGLVVWSSGPITLAPFESRPLSIDAQIPIDVAEGRYKLAIVADSGHAIAEVDESNNVIWSPSPLRITGRAPDLVATSIRAGVTEAAPGAPLQLFYAARNAGNVAGRLELRAYLSTNGAISTSDLPLGTPVVVDLAPLETTSGTISATLPASLPTGTYRVGAVVDPDNAIAELDETNNARAGSTLDVLSTQVAIVTDDLPPATLTRPYSARVRAIGGDGQFTFRLTNGTVPRGMIFDAAKAEVFGIPLESGTFSLEFEARSARRSARKTLELVVLDPDVPLAITTRALPAAVVGSDYAVTIGTAGGTEPFAWRAVGDLPAGLFLAIDGTILGVPEQPALASFGVEVRDSASHTATVGLSLEVRPSPNLRVLTGGALPAADAGKPYQHQLIASGGIEPYRWTAVTALPPGLALSESGALSGAPECVGPYRFRVQVQDAVAATDANELTLEVISADRFVIETEALPIAAPGAQYKAVVRAQGGDEPYTWTLVEGEGELPAGVAQRPGLATMEDEKAGDLVLTGIVPVEGTWGFTVRLEDNRCRRAERAFAISAQKPPPAPVIEPDDGGCRCVASSATVPGALAPAFGFGALLLAARRRK